MRWLVLVVVVACSSKQGTTTNGSGVGTSQPPATSGCEAIRKKVEDLYRAEAEANKEKPERVAEAVSDNTTMVMSECGKSEHEVRSCVVKVSTAAELEKQCLARLDDEGSEGEALRK